MDSNHPLPAALLSPADAPRAKALMARARAALELLERQLVVFELCALFESNPSMSAFRYELGRESDDEGGLFYYPIARANREASGDERDGEDPGGRCRLIASEWVGSQSEDWMSAFENHLFRRPRPADNLLESLMAQCLGPEAFAQWQAIALAQAAPPAPSLPHRSI